MERNNKGHARIQVDWYTEPENGCQQLQCNLSVKKKGGEKSITCSIGWTTAGRVQVSVSYFKSTDKLVWVMNSPARSSWKI